MGIKLVSTDLLSLKDLMNEGFAAAKTSDEKIGRGVTKVAQTSHGRMMDWEREVEHLKKEIERQGKEIDTVKTEIVDIRTENGALKLVNLTLNKVNDVLRGQLQAQQTSFQAKEVEWEKRLKDIEVRCAQQVPTTAVDWTEVQSFGIKGQSAEDLFKHQKKEAEWERRLKDIESKVDCQVPAAVVDWAEVQGFEIRSHPAEELFKYKNKEEKADQQKNEEIPLLDKEMLEPQEKLAGKELDAREFEWRMSTGLTLEQEPMRQEERPPAEAARDEDAPPTTQGETVGQQEVLGSVGQDLIEAELRGDLKVCQESTTPQDMPLVAGLEDALGSLAT
ncbi:hypothetical protein CBR_g32694 [Chara braunii]|uniref:Uncharacterized protein n=1 Tax=Chara braunii TaxID=69332 RepID=A0A388LH84_CHABU|nr:hypothetical protein CBR_g32694 [Chara braunii]|eukprot:GBG81700.1 hypothetical protein CBR_g32694 [Chara braunii]